MDNAAIVRVLQRIGDLSAQLRHGQKERAVPRGVSG